MQNIKQEVSKKQGIEGHRMGIIKSEMGGRQGSTVTENGRAGKGSRKGLVGRENPHRNDFSAENPRRKSEERRNTCERSDVNKHDRLFPPPL